MSTKMALRIHRALKWLRVPQSWRLQLMVWEWRWRARNASAYELAEFITAVRALDLRRKVRQ